MSYKRITALTTASLKWLKINPHIENSKTESRRQSNSLSGLSYMI